MKVQDMAQNLYSDTRGQSERPVTFTGSRHRRPGRGRRLVRAERIPELSLDEIGALAELPYAQRAVRIYRAFDVDLPPKPSKRLWPRLTATTSTTSASAPSRRFRPTPTCWSYGTAPRARSRTWALQCLPRFFSASAAQLREQGKLDHDFLILVATSGDTAKPRSRASATSTA